MISRPPHVIQSSAALAGKEKKMREKRSFRQWLATGKVNRRLVMVTFMFITTAPADRVYIYSFRQDDPVQLL